MSFHVPPIELARKVEDWFAKAQKWNKPVFSSFFSEGELVVLRSFLKQYSSMNFLLYGGYIQAQRRMLGIFPLGDTSLEEFPIVPLTITYRVQDAITHRDVLGALMAMQIRRDCLGDILVEEGKTVIFVKPPVDSLALQLKKIGKVGITVCKGADLSQMKSPAFIERNGVVASNRLDAIIRFACRVSRKEAAELVQRGAVRVNDQEALSISSSLQQGDILSVRGHGRYRFGGIKYQNKKGRLCILLDEYA